MAPWPAPLHLDRGGAPGGAPPRGGRGLPARSLRGRAVPAIARRALGLEQGRHREQDGATSRTGSRGPAHARAPQRMRRLVERMPSTVSTCPGRGERMLSSMGLSDTTRHRLTDGAHRGHSWCHMPDRKTGEKSGQGGALAPQSTPSTSSGWASLPVAAAGFWDGPPAGFGLDRGSKPGPWPRVPHPGPPLPPRGLCRGDWDAWGSTRPHQLSDRPTHVVHAAPLRGCRPTFPRLGEIAIFLILINKQKVPQNEKTEDYLLNERSRKIPRKSLRKWR